MMLNTLRTYVRCLTFLWAGVAKLAVCLQSGRTFDYKLQTVFLLLLFLFFFVGLYAFICVGFKFMSKRSKDGCSMVVVDLHALQAFLCCYFYLHILCASVSVCVGKNSGEATVKFWWKANTCSRRKKRHILMTYLLSIIYHK